MTTKQTQITTRLTKQHDEALGYVALAKCSANGSAKYPHGKLDTVKISTRLIREVTKMSGPFQGQDVEHTTYWANAAFDKALSEVVAAKFEELAVEALTLMKRQVDESMILEESELRERLAAIERLKQEAA